MFFYQGVTSSVEIKYIVGRFSIMVYCKCLYSQSLLVLSMTNFRLSMPISKILYLVSRPISPVSSAASFLYQVRVQLQP